ncbi:hypothetical protein K8I61_07190 [bacterium]|nr:hypothetical protein [bacterium]
MIAAILRLLPVIFAAVLFLAAVIGCVPPGGGDVSSAADDDTADDDDASLDDDSADDDSVLDNDATDDDSMPDDDALPDDDFGDDDTVADDDTTMDDDTLDDDTLDDDTFDDDTADDDTGDDDTTWPEVCDDPSPPADECADALFKLYCDVGFPVIKDDIHYTQSGAIAACRLGTDPVWADIVDCSAAIFQVGLFIHMGYPIMPFVACMQESWPAQQTGVFDATLWRAEEPAYPPLHFFQSLNFWAFDLSVISEPLYIEFAGAVTDPGIPMLRGQFVAAGGDEHTGTFVVMSESGNLTSMTDDTVTFWLAGWYEWATRFGYEIGETGHEFRLVPLATP